MRLLRCFAQPFCPLATRAVDVLLPALVYVLTRRRAELRLSLG